MDVSGPQSLSAGEQARRAASDGEVATDVKATLGRKSLVKLSSVSKLVQDMQDEISFAHSERVDSEETLEENLEDRTKQVRERMIKRVRSIYQPDLAGNNQHQQMQRQMARLRNAQYRHPDQLLEDLGEACGDKGEVFAMLVAMGDELEEGSPAARMVEDAIVMAAARWEHEITAGANTLSKAAEFAAQTGVERERFQRSYQKSVVGYQFVIKTIAELVQEFGIERFQAGAEFLQEAALTDMAAMPCSVETEQLEHTLLELQGVKIFNTWHEGVQEALERAARKDAALAKIKRGWLLEGFVRSLEQPHEFDTSMKQKFTYADEVANQILLLQDIKGVIAETPVHYFSEGGKQRAVAPWQNEIDRLIYEEAAR